MKPKIKLIIIGGSIATGKSTISKFLAEKTGLPRVSFDEIKEAIFDAGGYKDRAWSKQISATSFPVFQQLIKMYLERNESLIAEATFIWNNEHIWLQEFAKQFGVELVQIWLVADPKIARERFIERSMGTRHPGHYDSLDEVLEEFDERYFSKTFEPLLKDVRTMKIDTTDIAKIDLDSITTFVTV